MKPDGKDGDLFAAAVPRRRRVVRVPGRRGRRPVEDVPRRRREATPGRVDRAHVHSARVHGEDAANRVADSDGEISGVVGTRSSRSTLKASKPLKEAVDRDRAGRDRRVRQGRRRPRLDRLVPDRRQGHEGDSPGAGGSTARRAIRSSCSTPTVTKGGPALAVDRRDQGPAAGRDDLRPRPRHPGQARRVGADHRRHEGRLRGRRGPPGLPGQRRDGGAGARRLPARRRAPPCGRATVRRGPSPGPKLKPAALVQYWAVAADRNTITGPGTSESRRFSLFITTPEQAVARLDTQISDYAKMLESSSGSRRRTARRPPRAAPSKPSSIARP